MRVDQHKNARAKGRVFPFKFFGAGCTFTLFHALVEEAATGEGFYRERGMLVRALAYATSLCSPFTVEIPTRHHCQCKPNHLRLHHHLHIDPLESSLTPLPAFCKTCPDKRASTDRPGREITSGYLRLPTTQLARMPHGCVSRIFMKRILKHDYIDECYFRIFLSAESKGVLLEL